MTSPLPTIIRPSSARSEAFALVIVLIILTLLTVIAVGYLSSMASERATAAAFANKAKAAQAAQAGADGAMATLRQCFKSFPDSCTVWDTTQGLNDVKNPDGTPTYNPGTSLYFRALSATPSNTDDNRPPMLSTTSPDSRQIFVLPLTSGVVGALAKPESTKTQALPTTNSTETDATKQNFVDLNTPRYQYDSEGWIGSPPGHTDTYKSRPAPHPIRAPWVEIKDANGNVNSRYAYWIEDESFKANVNYGALGDNSDPSNPHIRRDNLADPKASDPLGYVSPLDVDLLGPIAALTDTSAKDDAQAIFDARKLYPTVLFPEAHAFEHATGLTKTVSDQLRYLTTTNSGGLNLSRHGSQRLNVNAMIQTTDDTGKMRTQLEELIGAMRFHAPKFGQRFYRNSTASTSSELNGIEVPGDGISKDSQSNDYSLIYMYKVAANIRDAIDTDSHPTFVLQGGSVRTPSKLSVWPDDPFWAVGKDSAPYLSECGTRFTGVVSGGRYTLNIDYYIEVWNMGTRDIKASDLGPNPTIRIANPTKWVGSNRNPLANPTETAFNEHPDLGSDIGPSPSATRDQILAKNLRDFDLPISKCYNSDGSGERDIIFPAGCCTVLTTDAKFNHTKAGALASQDYNVSEGGVQPPIVPQTEASQHVLMCKWAGSGTSSYSGALPNRCDIVKMLYQDTASSDYETDILIQTDAGIIDGLAVALPITGIGSNTMYFNYTGSGNQPPVFGGYLRGNWTATSNAANEGTAASAVGDPRTNNEQIAYSIGGIAAEVTRFKNWDVAPRSSGTTHPYTGLGVIPTLGLPNYISIRPKRVENPWGDYPPLFSSGLGGATTADDIKMSGARAPAFFPDGPLSSIAQLGDVYDPARIVNGTPTSSHGGGRTFRIGQHDDRWDGDQTSESRAWTSWRLLDFFCIADHADQPRLVDYYGVEEPGLININGVARDNGAAIKSALLGFQFQPSQSPFEGDAALDVNGTPPASAPNIQKLVDQLITRVASPLTTKDGSGNTIKNYGVNQTGAGPFWERGEMSELPLFGRTPTPPQGTSSSATTYPTTDLAGVDMSLKVFDRGREELYRRLAEMITTRGDTFSVYTMGQAVTQQSPTGPKIYSATQRLKVTFRLAPKGKADANGVSKAFHPGTDENGKTLAIGTTDDALKQRFDKPDHYDIQVIASSADN